MIKKKKENGVIEIDLTGSDGNAFNLLAIAMKLSRQLNMDGKKITDEMMSGDYENLVKVFDKHFGDFVILYR